MACYKSALIDLEPLITKRATRGKIMKCSRCNKEIRDNESYFSGSLCPPCNDKGERKFGCSPYSYYCENCMKDLPTFFYQPERLRRVDTAM